MPTPKKAIPGQEIQYETERMEMENSIDKAAG
jgi:hypothetical protein